MPRTLLAVLAGLAVMMLTVAAMEWLGHAMFPPPAGINLADPDALERIIRILPVGSLAMVAGGWALGSLAGAWVAARVARQFRLSAALAVGAVMTMLVVANFVMVPHPLWMILAGIALPLPLAWLGWRSATGAASRKPTWPAAPGTPRS